ncbi:hypothetical protein H2200_011310 [Cladophialophora chaetospira]|uniref:Heterokaryon incompatibility domain-containing protein n=1 Tax=Cladophialophora chaetospira TaxID=386627 RepID=A0AA39CDQ0_9EURO|nr:hypothetical protein H2200_011310 [Cladophialophora chaetospira]
MLHTVPFNAQDPPLYEALSYAWGSTESPALVTVGETGSAVFPVTRNLAIALLNLRYRDRPRTMWIDAICVNQMDLVERSHQVQLMGDIYKSATRVIAWVGPETDDSSDALNLMELIGTNVEVDWHAKTSKPANSSEESAFWGNLTHFERPPLDENQCSAIRALLLRPYFRRLWIQQEIRLAGNNVIIVCGTAHLSWKVFGNAIFIFLYRFQLDLIASSSSGGGDYNDRLEGIRRLCLPVVAQPFDSRIRYAQYSLCSDPRDRIYALLSIQEQARHNGSRKLNIRPDYDAPVELVYLQAFVEIVSQTEHLDVLATCELHPDNPHNLPSWVPDFSRPSQVEGMKNHYTAGFTFPNCGILADRVLRVRGKSTCRLQTTELFRMGERSWKDIFETIRHVRLHMSLDTPYVAGGTLLDAFCDALVCGSFAENSVPSQLLYQREMCRDLVKMTRDADPDWAGLAKIGPVMWTHAYFSEVFRCCTKRAFCTTEEGYIAVAPASARPGDQVCTLLGCQSSMLLRPTGSRWQVVGECYLPGLASGEALAGPLPESYRKTLVLDEDKTFWMPYLLNISNDKLELEDPRFDISEYPEPGATIETTRWNPTEKATQKCSLHFYDKDAADRLAYPWREENLKKRGVLFEDFYLI